MLTPAKQILASIATIEPARKPERDPEEDARAEREMWRWYLQWSAIAQVAVKERRVLRLLGYLQSSGGTVSEPVIGEEEDEPVIGGGEIGGEPQLL